MRQAIDASVRLLKFTRALENRRDRLVLHSKQSQFVSFTLDETDRMTPTDIRKVVGIESNRVIENLMLLANEYAARTLLRKFSDTAMIRKHPGLDVKACMEELQKIDAVCTDPGMKAIFAELLSAIPSPHSGDIASVMSRIESNELKIYFSNMLSMNMTPAEYTFPTDENSERTGLRHFALNLDMYTHFTSPIRRFPDIVVHRQLLEKSAVSNAEADLVSKTDMEIVCKIANDAKQASRDSQGAAEKVFFAAYLNLTYGEKGMKTKGMVQEVTEKGLNMSIPSLGGVTFQMYYHLLPNVTDFRHHAASRSTEIRKKGANNKPMKITVKVFDLLDVRLLAPTLDVMLEDPVTVTLA